MTCFMLAGMVVSSLGGKSMERSKLMERNDVSDLVWEIEPHLAGQPPSVQGAALADLLATWLAGHFAGSAAENAALRDELLTAHIAVVRALIPENEAEILSRQ
jgi:hypothetical protein